MPKTHLKLWMDVCLMVGSSVFKWHDMVAQQVHKHEEVVEAADDEVIVEGNSDWNEAFICLNLSQLILYFINFFLRSRDRRRSRSRSRGRRSLSRSRSRSESKSSRGRSNSPVKKASLSRSRSKGRSHSGSGSRSNSRDWMM